MRHDTHQPQWWWWYHHWQMASLLLLVCLPSWTLCFSLKPPIPITVLSGFLGSGKTTLLQRLLQNQDGLRIAIIVNDVASINIDSKLVVSNSKNGDNQRGPAGMVQLQNGCACCSQADELLASVAELVTLNDLRGDDDAFDHIVIECSGVADPKGIRAQFQQAAYYRMPLLERVALDTMVTVVDAASYLEYLESTKLTSVEETPELYYPDGKIPENDMEDDDDDIPAGLRALLQPSTPMSTGESVAALLISQTETADVVLLNKIDLVSSQRVQQIESFVRACCPTEARIHRTTYANVAWQDILAVAHGKGVVMSGVVDDHREAVKSAKNLAASTETGKDESNGHSHDHTTSAETKESHSHAHNSHAHEHMHEDNSHDHDHTAHSHDHVHETTSHSHEHSHACDDPNCTDESHDHSDTTHAGIASMVYQARRPFHPGRLTAFLRQLPIRIGLPPAENDDSVSQPVPTELQQIVRSKGFCWCADSNRVAYYWSQAGPSFEMSQVGAWWATLPREQWPPSAVSSILADFDDEAANKDRPVGDRRQEIVLIGTSLQNPEDRSTVRMFLDQCLLQDDEWEEYWSCRNDEESLQFMFPTRLLTRHMSF